ncbi:phosphatidate cytidylyltransferase [Schaalia suimastitidis]|uniref:phosphatidate cytidylyltransferase n=1 Tax=Schaalia suimastitidis TaxID=121163 RepID=UPI000404D950|nr:phosphatidate cytidylyltransferase [Schaalia suimastitidis]
MPDQPSSRLVSRLLEPTPSRDHPALAATGRAGRNLPAAVGTAVVLIGLLVGSLFFLPELFVGLVATLSVLAIWELSGAFARVGVRIALPPLYVGTVGMLICVWTLSSEALLAALVLTCFSAILWRLLDGNREGMLRDISASVFTAAYVPFLASFVVLLVSAHANPWIVLLHVGLTTLSDTGGWLAGILFGRHPMAPRLSPKKSWEGFAGSILLCTGGAVGAFIYLGHHWAWGVLAGTVIAFVATVGDLTESLIKREVGLKDMSNLLPGHGGVLDRVDSILMTAPVLHLLLLVAQGGPR